MGRDLRYPKLAARLRSNDNGRSLETPLARLCCYYLACLSHENAAGAGRAAASVEGSRGCVELEALNDPIPATGSAYTRGLEFELRALQTVEESTCRATALGAWMSGRADGRPPSAAKPLLDVVALNTEQRHAVRQGLANPLTVITGPPGTGKSQVVASIVVNAALQGRTVLFASKNNKAVDLVESRVNGLGPRPVLLRLGGGHGRLAGYLASLLASTATDSDQDLYREYSAIHAELSRRSAILEAELASIVSLRNEVDRLEQHAESIRQEIGEQAFGRLRASDVQRLWREVRLLQSALDQAAGRPFWTRLMWPFVRRSRLEQLAAARERLQGMLRGIGPVMPAAPSGSSTFDDWKERDRTGDRLSQTLAGVEYFAKLAALTEGRSLEEINREGRLLHEDLVRTSRLLWEAWLRLQPSRAGHGHRKILGNYGAILQLIIAARNCPPSRDVFRQYHQLFQKITSALGWWAVTSLSARGRVPFAPGLFDVLVIDEASQCDIASALPLLFRARRAVVIGDPMQLQHISSLSRAQDQELLIKHGLISDYAGWAYSVRSLFDLANSLCRGEDTVVLREHHRSHADIIEFSNQMFYGGRLRIATNYDQLRRPCSEAPAVRWVDVRGLTVRPAGGGAINEKEARAVLGEVERLIRQGYPGSIGVVSPFRAQATRIRALIEVRPDLIVGLKRVEFLADTVHRFQGDERDVMIFSPAVSTGVSDTAIGFLRRNPNLFNVAISRARAAVIVVGNREAAINSHVEYLARFAAYSGRVGHGKQPVARSGAADLGPEYPAALRLTRASTWDRQFYRAVYRAGIRPIPHHPAEKYLLDFAVFEGNRRLAIGIDSANYHRSWDSEVCRREQIRDQRLIELGWDVMKFWVYQIRDDLDRCVERVAEWLQSRPCRER
jgi:very-short-patch-repair endonuclease